VSSGCRDTRFTTDGAIGYDAVMRNASAMAKTALISTLLALAAAGCSDDSMSALDAGADGRVSDARPADGRVGDSAPGDAAPVDATPTDGPRPGDSSGADSSPGPGLYRPDNGPSHQGGKVVNVSTKAQILAAISAAAPGDVITIAPGTYAFSQLISVKKDGLKNKRIFFRAAKRGTVTINLTHIENFKIDGKFWIFENIKFFGACQSASGCEHAFHIVGDADDLIFRNNEVVNFASHVKLNGTVVGAGPAKSFPDRIWFINNFWHNTKYVPNNAPHNILNLDGGKDHVVRGNIFADFAASPSLPKSASAIYPKASTTKMLIEMNLIVCEKARTAGETTRGIQLGDGAPATICDGDANGDGKGDCVENGQNQQAIVRNNIVIGCNNGGSSAGIMVNSDRESKLQHNTVYGTGQRNAVFYEGHANFDTFFRFNILEDGFNTSYAKRTVNASNNLEPNNATMKTIFKTPDAGDFSIVNGSAVQNKDTTSADALYDFCGYPRGAKADRGAIEYSTTYNGKSCATVVKEMFDRIPSS
jgi:hypothetical protein